MNVFLVSRRDVDVKLDSHKDYYLFQKCIGLRLPLNSFRFDFRWVGRSVVVGTDLIYALQGEPREQYLVSVSMQ